MSRTRPSELEKVVASQPEWFPLDLRARYYGKQLKARIDAGGTVIFGGKRYRSPSAAALAARRENGYASSETDRGPQTNGWRFWHFVDGEGHEWPLDALRHL